MEVAVLLANMGGPDSLETVEPFLREIFSDPQIIDVPLPAFLRHHLARFIAGKRRDESVEIYRKLGGKTPLHEIMRKQARSLQVILQANGRDEFRFHVYPANRYGRPSLAEVLSGLPHDQFQKIVVISMYPFYATSTSGSITRELQRLSQKLAIPDNKILYIERYGEHRDFVGLLAKQITDQLDDALNTQRPLHLLLSAHSIPKRHIRKGDPYFEIVRKVVNALKTYLPEKIRLSLSFQSKIGPIEWLGPATDKKIVELAKSGVQRLFVYPLGFVADNSETIYEIGMLYRSLATKHGIREFVRLEALNDYPDFMDFLAHLVLEKMGNKAN